ncbi:carbohydrate (chondroitin 4) sulfotransferase [Seminavis robusta]|uniref:Carbohydrate (Chondroitin 4) sulfotransferase n=1 Tax=Seminavis robusta TaxID=568900 RepID=A0A9N8EPV2_9STRA|nr:carbohydrate (chondroitin 4) sulfotransferase [Seminavis robusta]|eukprot:Sro1359_g265980.1 carbohydrate (chondroitin 4) sulfotransferase (357) ;mRNA; f:16874-17944
MTDHEEKQERIREALAGHPVNPGQNWAVSNDKHKILFCWMQKVGCTFFRQVFINLHREGITEAHPSTLAGKHQKFLEILHSAEWNKVVFYREPLSRFLSGWKDKCRGTRRNYCKHVFGGPNVTCVDAIFLLKDMNPQTLDGHFHPQVQHCNGLTRPILDNIYTMVEELKDHNSTRHAVRKMLQPFELTDEQLERVLSTGEDVHAHATNANTILMQYYQDPQLVGIIVKYFIEDYKVFQIQAPDFAQTALYGLRERNDPYALSDEEMQQLGLPLTPPASTTIHQVDSSSAPGTTADLILLNAALANDSSMDVRGFHVGFVFIGFCFHLYGVGAGWGASLGTVFGGHNLVPNNKNVTG